MSLNKSDFLPLALILANQLVCYKTRGLLIL